MTLDDLRGIHTGKCAIILGAGPSLRFADERICKDRVSIALNDSIVKFPYADYYMTMDPTMPARRHWSHVLRGKFPCILKRGDWDTHGGYENMVGEGKPIAEERAVLVAWKHDIDQVPRTYRVAKDDTRFIIGGSSAHSAVNFAVVAGCETIYLVGCDCILTPDGRRYFWQYDDQREYIGGMADEDPDQIFNAREPEDSVLEKYVGAGWSQLRKCNPEITIVDASGGALSSHLMTTTVDDLQAG